MITGLTQSGSAFPALFRIFINDLARYLRKAQGKKPEEEGDSLQDPAKLVADDVIIIDHSEDELETLLDICTTWAERNYLEWKPQKCYVVYSGLQNNQSSRFKLDGQEIPTKSEAMYLRVTVTHRGFVKNVEKEFEKDTLPYVVCQAIIRQPFFD